MLKHCNTHACKCATRAACKCKLAVFDYCVSREDFEGGCKKLGVATTDALRGKLPALRAELAPGSAAFADFFLWVFGFYCDQGQKSPKAETLVELLPALLARDAECFPLLDDFLAFLGTKKGVTKDAWSQVLPFGAALKAAGFAAGAPGGDFAKVGGDAWPILFDEFVEFAQARRGAA